MHPRAADRSIAHLLPTLSIPMCTQDPLYRAAAPVVHSELCPGVVLGGVQERAAAPFRSPSTLMFVYCMWPWPPARLIILSLQVSLPTCTEIGLLCSVSLILTPSRSELHAAGGCCEHKREPVAFLRTDKQETRLWQIMGHIAPFMGCRRMWCNAKLSRR